MEKLKSAINWFEIPTIDFDRAVRFYSEIYAFDMPTSKMGDVKMGFFMHEQGVGTGGAIVSGDGNKPSEYGSKLYLNGGADLLTVLDRVTDAGGSIIMGKTLISEDIGYFAIIDDSEGNRINLHSMN